MKNPTLYHLGSTNSMFTRRVFLYWIANGFYQSLVFYYIPYWSGIHAVLNNGQLGGLWIYGMTIYTSIIITLNLQLFLNVKNFVYSILVSIPLSIFIWFIYALCYCSIDIESNKIFGTIYILMGQAKFWFVLILVPIIALMPELLIKIYKQLYNPSKYDTIREAAIAIGKGSRNPLLGEEEHSVDINNQTGINNKSNDRRTSFAFSQDEGQREALQSFTRRKSTISGNSTSSSIKSRKGARETDVMVY